MPLWLLITRRIAVMVISLFFVALLTFLIVNVLPGDVATAILGDTATPDQVAALRGSLGLDQPVLLRFMKWFFDLLQGDFGTSLTFNRPVGPMIAGRLLNSATLALICMIVVIPVSILFGAIAAVKQGSLLDRAITGLTTFLFGMPEYVLALGAMLIFAIWLQWLPGAAMINPGESLFLHLDTLVLPVLVISLGGATYIIQMTRASMIDVLASPYVRTALLKGIPRWQVILKHALPNAMLPTLVEIGLSFGALLGGLVIIETIFNFAGIGQLMVMAVQSRDVPVLQACVLVIAAAYSLGSLLADIASMLLNPKLRN
ncbi:ABC transporter permease [Pseudooceanicola sp. CBS1P-1]|uniref:ABC transporter permease subunit n=1 Tax=Pseudooceanicola albus TaxID=2692189 RepID=A0A6L7GBP4_9RHOB|nr:MULTISPECIES: ABC transporter permease [Pseudooceanicola]MBT9386574.1 ABC transporter permease [Pseudooceanicola endophyticus]MXN20690.1 ABC transporter permease subunit [Pseudooceanicola albus]